MPHPSGAVLSASSFADLIFGLAFRRSLSVSGGSAFGICWNAVFIGWVNKTDECLTMEAH
jgi:hypothetical protein